MYILCRIVCNSKNRDVTWLSSTKGIADYILEHFDAMKDYVPVKKNDAFLYELTRKNVQNIDI